MRKFFFTALIFSLLIILLCSCAYADAVLYRGSKNIGSVQTSDKDGNYCVSVEDVGKLLGFSASRSGEELLLKNGKSTLRLIVNSAAAWRGISIVALSSAPFEQNGKFWLEASSVIALFQSSAGTGQNNKLRFNKISGGASLTAKSDTDFGKFDTPEPKTTTAQRTVQQTPSVSQAPTITAKTPEVSQAPKTAQRTPTTPQNPAVMSKTPDASQVPAARSRTPEVTQAPAIASKTPEVSQTPAITMQTPEVSQLPAKNPDVSQTPAISRLRASSVKVSSKVQPKIETFKPGINQKEKAESYSGIIKSVSWSYQDGTQKKIRAIFETNENADPQVFMSKGVLHALFESGPENLEVPYSNVGAEIMRSSKGLEILFTPKDITKAEKFVLDNPHRIVFTFTFPKNITIAENKPVNNAPTPAYHTRPSTPAVNIPAKTEQNTRASTPTVQIPTTRPEPITIDNSRSQSPAVNTLPNTIIIPTSPGAAQRLALQNRKTIVIDPGHGGKDPGASANGVTEKNVNLGIGLELEKVLLARGYNVIMTRNNDVYLKLQERTDIANDANADLFVSIHVNALPSKKSMTGFEIYIMALPTDKDAMNLAKIENREYVEGKGMDTANVDRRTEMLLHILGDMQQNNKISESTDFAASLYNAGARNGLPMRRVAQAPFFVLRGAGMPAVLIETGFVTNATEAKKLTTSAYQQQIANAMAEGIINYLK
ncbi:MAG: N-acetylmuramoyl-L-alanine amidase [Synergistaceae bacterium]|nr:N-acetylmuramoyl-L-alanine amidase [Synergistaceae bacterium]